MSAAPTDILYIALGEPLGVWITTSDPTKLKYSLYQHRAKAADPALKVLQIRTSPRAPSSELWIVNTEGALLKSSTYAWEPRPDAR